LAATIGDQQYDNYFFVLGKIILHWSHLSVLCDRPNYPVPSFPGWEAEIVWRVGLVEELGGEGSWRAVGSLGFCDGLGELREFVGGDAAKRSHGKCTF
jgi:hypothetical protein